MSDITGIKVKGRRAKLIQAVCIPERGCHRVVKAVFIGVKEVVKAVCADVIDKKSIELESALFPRLTPEQYHHVVRTQVRSIPTFDYDVGEVYYPHALNSIVTGSDSTIALHAFPVFQQNYGASIPLLKEYSSVLWELAVANGYTNEIAGVGLPEGERVFTLKFPELEIFEQHLLERMPRIYSLALEIVKEDVAGLARAA